MNVQIYIGLLTTAVRFWRIFEYFLYLKYGRKQRMYFE